MAKPLSKTLRGKSSVPTHQIIYTPQASAHRSNFGIKTTLPSQIGRSHIVFNDIDNAKNMPDVEKYSGHLYTRKKFQETGIAVKNYLSEQNPLFPSETTKTKTKSSDGTILGGLNLNGRSGLAEVKKVLASNSALYSKFKSWILRNHPQVLVLQVSSQTLKGLVVEFVSTHPEVNPKEFSMTDMVRNDNSNIKIQGTGGFSYAQKGRLANSPNGIKHGVIAPGRIVHEREAAIGGLVAGVNDRTIMLQLNFSKNVPNAHSRQFVSPFKITDVEIGENGRVKMFADGVATGKWMHKAMNGDFDRQYEASNPKFARANERNAEDNAQLQNLLNLINLK